MKKLLALFLLPMALFGAAGDIKIGYKAPNNISWIDAIFATQNNVLLGLGSAGVPQVATSATLNLNAVALPAGLSGTMFQLGQADGTSTRLTMDGFATNPIIDLRRANGTNAAKTALLSGNFLGSISAAGYGASAYSSGRGSINFVANENWSNSAQGTNIEFRTNAAGATSSTKTYTFGSTGMIFEATGMKLKGDFSNATRALRLAFQDATTNNSTNVGILPNGTNTNATLTLNNSSDADNAGRLSISSFASGVFIDSNKVGTGTTRPIALQIDGVDKLTIGTDGNTTTTGTVTINQATLTNPSAVVGSLIHVTAADTSNAVISLDAFSANSSIIGRTASGTSASPSALSSGAGLLLVGGRGYGATGYGAVATGLINIVANETFTDSAQGTNIFFETTPNGSTTRARALTIGADKSLTVAGSLIVPTSTPASAAAAGVAGTITWDSSYIYVCVSANSWKRVAISAW